jgi:signal peptidase I
MRSKSVRSRVVAVLVLVIGGLGWFYLAPTQIGGSTRYLITHGISMEPLLHTGDLVLVRPADNYRVGQVVAYHSTLLHTIVLHRIIRIQDGHYTFKGENNDFIDPTHPTRALLVGRMWLHIASGGVVLSWLKKPAVAALLTGFAAMLLLLGADQKRRRRDRRRPHEHSAARPKRERSVSGAAARPGLRPSNQYLLVAFAVAAVVFAALSVVAFTRPTTGTATVRQSYTQQLTFGYHARAKAGPVYPNGIVTTGAPIYLQLVHRVTVAAAYRLTSAAPHRLHGSIRMLGTLTNSSGWSDSISLGSPTQFVGDRAVASATINLSRLESLTNRITAQIGGGEGGGYTLAIAPQVKLAGEIAGEPLSTGYSPSLDLELGPAQLLSGASAIVPSGSTAGAAQQGLTRSSTGILTSSRTSVNALGGVPIQTARWIALAALLLASGLALLAGRRELRTASDPDKKINGRYKHLIVPVASVETSPDHPPIDVSSIDALAQLAERSERLILHDHQEGVDTYLVDDEGTWFRYREMRVGATNGNGKSNGDDVQGVGTGVISAGAVPPDAAISGPASEHRDVLEPAAAPIDPEIHFPEAEELEALLRAVPDDSLGHVEGAMYLTAAMTGMRKGELLGLCWRDVDFGARRFHVRRDFVRGEYGAPTSKRSPRSVPLESRVATALELLSHQTRWTRDDDLVFAHPETGKPMERSKLRKHFKAAIRAAEVPEIRFRDLRQGFCTRMAAQGVPIHVLQEMMGHRDLKTTLVHAGYAPSAPEPEREPEPASAPEPESAPEPTLATASVEAEGESPSSASADPDRADDFTEEPSLAPSVSLVWRGRGS